MKINYRRSVSFGRGFAFSALFAGSHVHAQIDSNNRDILNPNTGVWPVDGVALNGATFINLGLQGIGRVSASSSDTATGETLGSVSDFQVTSWRRNTDDSYSGVFSILPDRGYNSGAIFSNYGARVNEFAFDFNPYTSTATTTLQNQIDLRFLGSKLFTYDHDANSSTPAIPTTGLLASGVGSLLGQQVPVNAGNTTLQGVTVQGRLTVDAEGLAFDTRPGKAGTGWISDEYGASIYHFNVDKQIDGVIKVPEALVPHRPVGTTDFGADPAANGRRNNQGFEGLAISPDGTRLFALLQSATLQDSGAGNQGRSNTRMLVYDISGADAPSAPIHQYAIQLPRIDDNGGTPAVNRTGAQSAIVALTDHQLLILSRDGNGRGASGVPVFKSILLADTQGATDIHGRFDAEGNAVAAGGTLDSSVKPIAWTEALNLLGKLDLGVTELEQFGINFNTAPGDFNTFSEKWEGLSLVPALDPSKPNDYFLFVANDNDFMTRSGTYTDASGNLQSFDAGLENDTMVLAFRVTAVGVPDQGLNTAALLTGALGSLGLMLWRCRRGH